MGVTELFLQTDFQDFCLLSAPEMQRRFKKRKKERKQKKRKKRKKKIKKFRKERK